MPILALSLLAAAAAAPAVPGPTGLIRDRDLRCVAAVSAALGILADRKTDDAEQTAGLTAVFMYYLGKVDARRPGLDYARSLTALMNAPGYAQELPADLKRCGAEAEERGRTLQTLGERLKAAVPLGRAGAG